MNDVTPTRDTFNFTAYVQGKSTFPKFDHTVYLDQDNGIALAKAADEYTRLAERAQEIQKIQAAMSEQAYTPLVSEEADELYVELQDIEERTGELEKRIDDLKEKVHQSGLTLHFQVGSARKLGEVVQQGEKEYQERARKQNRRISEDDPEYQHGRMQYVLARQLAEYCTKVELPDGTEKSAPDVDGFEDLLNVLISAESVRLIQRLNEALDSSTTWAEHIDAGFPRRGDDVAGEPVGGASTENGQGLVSAAAFGLGGNGRDLG